MSQVFDNQADPTRDLWAERTYPLCTKLGLRIAPGPTPESLHGIPFESLRDRLQAAGLWEEWCKWGADGLTAGPAGCYPWDVEQFLRGLPNPD